MLMASSLLDMNGLTASARQVLTVEVEISCGEADQNRKQSAHGIFALNLAGTTMNVGMFVLSLSLLFFAMF